MKEITRIHLAKVPYNIEVAARQELEKYLMAVERAMHAEPEVMREIEARMVELLLDRSVAREGTITSQDVAALREQMGDSREFVADDQVESAEDRYEEKPDKRLMRSTDDAILGGVCAGIAAYFGINPWWIRLLAIISPFMTMGSAVVLYIILWVVMPPARTAAEKLQMRGEPVTLDNIKRLAPSDEASQRVVTVGARIIQVTLAIVALLVALGALIAVIVGGVTGVGLASWMNGFETQKWAWGMLASLVVGGIALVTLAGLLAYSAFRWSVTRSVGIVMLVSLLIGAVSISGISLFGMQVGSEFESDQRRLTKVVSVQLPSDMEGIKYVRPVGEAMVSYDARETTPRAELRYLDIGQPKIPEVTFTRERDVLIADVRTHELSNCPRLWLLGQDRCRTMGVELRMYGPFTSEPYTDGAEYISPAND